MATETISKIDSPKEMLNWQYRVILQQLDQIQLHTSDATCPCSLKDMGEYCTPKHLNLLASLANETAAMDSGNAEMLFTLGDEATEMHLKTKDWVCSQGEDTDIVGWSRGWRKRIEPLYYACQIKGEEPMELHHRGEDKMESRWPHKPEIVGSTPTPATMHKSIVEKTATICETYEGKLVMGNQAVGIEDKVVLDPVCPAGSKVVGVWHRHPGEFRPVPSKADIKEAGYLHFDTGGTACITGAPEEEGGAFILGKQPGRIAWTPCEKKHPAVKEKVESCVLDVKETMPERCFKANGELDTKKLGTKSCPNPYAICRASVKCQ